MRHTRKIVFALAPLALGTATSPASAQGIPVFDSSTYLQTLSTVTNTLKMIEQGKEQIETATNELKSLQKLTDVNSVASNMFDSSVRNIMPTTSMDAGTLFGGDLTRIGSLGTRASSIQSEYLLSGTTSADAAYNQALKDATGSAAATAAFGENTLAITQTRMAGLDTLRAKLDSATDPKDVMDLQARIAVEQAQLQNDQIKMQALQMAQSGRNQIANASAVTARAAKNATLYDDNILRK
ncbi:type IV secretion system protein [Novosphingobium sp. KN65.2]|uniref:type IV secretion system protein n=1 Tax=Novosphingobium sp. KN65.2 TaxID=1478134 RepID=UPI0005DF8E88|nr:type IV secretion system protein [Novosphingobium sp. KN65.2]CDO37987.1 Type IV secretion system family protein [Novosphingobium sp. KN65.2]